jgi:cytoskeletal protein CcmA (bactofilin family)
MSKDSSSRTPPEAVISIIGAGMSLLGDTETDGSLRIEGTVRGNVRAGKSVVIGKDGLVDGSIFTQDAVIAGRVSGGIHALSRLELQASSVVAGEIEAPRMQVEEGASVQGQVAVGEAQTTPTQAFGADPKRDAPRTDGSLADPKSQLTGEQRRYDSK